jgi:hypothetical protein
MIFEVRNAGAQPGPRAALVFVIRIQRFDAFTNRPGASEEIATRAMSVFVSGVDEQSDTLDATVHDVQSLQRKRARIHRRLLGRHGASRWHDLAAENAGNNHRAHQGKYRNSRSHLFAPSWLG